MLALVLKGVPFESRRLDTEQQENRAPAYLALNPKGQVPTLVWGDVVIRESLAILCWLDRAFPDRAIWGQDAGAAARVFEDVVLMSSDLQPPLAKIGISLMRGTGIPDEDITSFLTQTGAFEARLKSTAFLGGDDPMANDIWLYPALNWIARGVALNSSPPETLRLFEQAHPATTRWLSRMAALPGVAGTFPPHWSA